MTWIDIIVKLTPAFVTLVLGTVGGFIAYGQYKTNRDKLRLDLFEKRLEAYEKLQLFFNELFKHARVKNDTIPILAEARYRFQFLFGDEIEKHIDEVWDKTLEMSALYDKMYGEDSLPLGKERTRVGEQHSDLLKWHRDQRKGSKTRFARYLKFN